MLPLQMVRDEGQSCPSVLKRFQPRPLLSTGTTVNRQQDVPVSEFLNRLSKSGILSEGELNDVSATIQVDRDADARRFAQELVEKRMLTDWQTRVLCGTEDGELGIGEFVILEHIGDGGMGRVYKARSRDTGKIVAPKAAQPAIGER